MRRGDPFIAANAERLQAIAWVLLALQLLSLIIGGIGKAMVRLGAGGLDGKKLTREAMNAALQALSKFERLAKSHQVDGYRKVAWTLRRNGTHVNRKTVASIMGELGLISPQATITISNGTQTHTGELVLIGNGKFYGGSFPIFHQSDYQDGVLDACVFEKVNWQSLPRHLWQFASGKLFKPGGTLYLQGREFHLSSPTRAALRHDRGAHDFLRRDRRAVQLDGLHPLAARERRQFRRLEQQQLPLR